MSSGLRTAISQHGIASLSNHGEVYAYEVNGTDMQTSLFPQSVALTKRCSGYRGLNIMDDANIPSLLAAPFFGYLSADDETYQRTRALLLSAANPYYMRGPVISAIGGAHDGPGFAWPMASIVRILTSNDDGDITQQLHELVATTDGLGLIHESINTFNITDFTRQWFSWANGLFGQMILDLDQRKPELLKQSFQSNSTSE